MRGLKSKAAWYERDQAVIRRWVRLKTLPLGRRIARTYMRPYLFLKERKRHKQLQSALDAVAKRCRELEKTNFEGSKLLFNLALYLLLAERDIQTVKVDALTHHSQWKRNLSLRVMLLTLHELNLGSVTGQRLKPALESSRIEDGLRTQAYEIIRKTRKAQERARRILGPIRNNVIAHREPNALVQYDHIKNIESSAAFNVITEFYEAAHELYRILPQLMAQSGRIEGLAGQFIADKST